MSVILKKEENFRIISKPTVWDGDKSMKPFEVMKRYFSCSKPTVWDGEIK